MLQYTIRDATTMKPVAASLPDLAAATETLEGEQLAFLLNPPPGAHTLDLVITADPDTTKLGDVIVRFSTGRLMVDED